MRQRVERRLSRLRAPALAVAALVLASQLGALVHLVAVRHLPCEHGELVEVAAHADALAALAPAARHASRVALDAGDAAGHGHDHCLAAPLRRQHGGAQPRPALPPAPLALSPPPPAPPERAAAPRIALYRLAPKVSPPAAPPLVMARPRRS